MLTYRYVVWYRKMYYVSNGEWKDCEVSSYSQFPDDKAIKSLQEGESYKYLGTLEAGKFLEEKMNLNVSKEYIRSSRKVLKSKLNGGNLVREVNTWAIFLLRYSAAFVNWRRGELQAIDRKTRKLFTIYGALHPKSDVDRLYVPRKEGGRGLISIEDLC